MEFIRFQKASPNSKVDAYLARIEGDYRQALRRESANAVAILAAGLIGGVLGAFAYRNHTSTANNERPH